VLGACGGGGGGLGGPPLGNLTLTGKVVSVTGEPVQNVSVWISGRGPFFPDATGTFVVTQVAAPYTALVVDGSSATGDLWEDLTRVDPVLARGFETPAPYSATVDGSITGGVGFPTPPTHETVVRGSFDTGVGIVSTTVDGTTGTWSTGSVYWQGHFAVTARLVGLQYTLAPNGDPATFTGYGTLDVPLLLSDSITGQVIALSPVATTSISATLSLPPGLMGSAAIPMLEEAGFRPWVLGAHFTPASTFTLRMPSVAGLRRHVAFEATGPGGLAWVLHRDLPDPTVGLVVDVPPPTTEILPVAGAAGVDYGTLFYVTPSTDDRVLSVMFQPTGGLGPTIRLHTTATTFTIPDLSDVGLGLPDGVEYQWSLQASGPLASTDEATAAAPFASPLMLTFPDLPGPSFTCTTHARTFTFGP
jgi:hypothetical protein